jgi:alginate O-acetyltransferase complex protein AlgI
VLFNSLTFLVFFFVVFVLYLLIANWTAQKRLLLVASYLFYAAWNPPYVVILIFSTTLDWWLARLIWRSEDISRRKWLLVLSILSNLSLLGFFKYGNFLLVNFQSFVATFGVAYQPPALDIILPVGISFYTFASLSYTIDVYRREVHGDWSFLDYALFVSFFPHLVAGPIVRAFQLLPQMETPRRASSDQFGWGICLLILGLFSKVVMADSIFAPLVDQVYENPSIYSAIDIWCAVFGFAGQIYYDFSGYSLCAIGIALCFGFEFPDNFHYPYAARSFSDFWRRWHISLSTWLRDYLYIPLGGSRSGGLATRRNLLLTMLIGGLWHGASWMFVLWGGLHGLYLALEKNLEKRCIGMRCFPSSHFADLVITLLVFLTITLTWIPFRAPTLEIVKEIIMGFFRWDLPMKIEPLLALISLSAMLATIRWHFALRDSSLEVEFEKYGTVVQTTVIGCCLIAIFLCSGGDERAFIYFQF